MNTIYISWQMYKESRFAHRNIKETLIGQGVDATVVYISEDDNCKYASVTSDKTDAEIIEALKVNNAVKMDSVPTQEEIEAQKHQALALAQTSIQKLWIRRAMRVLELEDELDALLSTNPFFAKDWADTVNINLNDEMTVSAIMAGGVTQAQIDAIKIKAYELERTTI